jgi:hypothetical protein
MPTTKYQWNTDRPGPEPRLYITCLSSDKYTAIRWWDGNLWWDISPTRGSQAKIFKWPKGTAAAGIHQPGWMRRYDALALRKITDQRKVRWGQPYKHFEPAEVLTWLVRQGRLPADWPLAFQSEMRIAKAA